MKKPILLSAVGGDGRQFYITDILSEHFMIKTYGIYGDRKCDCFDIADALDGADIVLLPLPVTKDGVNINADVEIPFGEFVSLIDKKCKVYAGRIPPSFKRLLEEDHIEYFDYYEDTELIWKNADITAEGAVYELMCELESSIAGSNILVSGYGRIGKSLSLKLSALGANVTVAARKKDSIFEVKNTIRTSTDRMNYLRDGIFDTTRRYNAIVNTVPSRIFGKQNKEILENALYIELASVPNGGEPEELKRLCGKYISAASLPGRYAPKTAAEAIATSLLKHYVYEEDDVN